ncbi:DUF572-domain-containing protein [Hypoxylon fragiforme]|uniref:DUF572-domain-containing protein n=1 Tax=Hypoxylon fragiforme TaxID=63214 RepID=UPI0020C71913|nr:DUF572-domain-containing protein [Hypoxylon fragiforme]KAI2608302.1 DUF572-domain-containing protein [Hypoxylon fragiforme]
MSERKVLTKYYPPDFDPSQIKRVRAPKNTGPKVQTVRLAAPLYVISPEEWKALEDDIESNNQQLDEVYFLRRVYIQRQEGFYIRCTRCSGQITFKTDPKNQDYACESGAKRSTEPWRVGVDETDEQRLDRLEREGAEEEQRNAMVELETKTVDAKREMAVADALDEIRTRNARLERANQDGVEASVPIPVDNEAERLEREDAEAARRAFEFARQVDRMTEEVVVLEDGYDYDNTGFASTSASTSTATYTPISTSTPSSSSAAAPGPLASTEIGTMKPLPRPEAAASIPSSTASTDMPPPSFKRVVKKKKDHSALLGIKKKAPLV